MIGKKVQQHHAKHPSSFPWKKYFGYLLHQDLISDQIITQCLGLETGCLQKFSPCQALSSILSSNTAPNNLARALNYCFKTFGATAEHLRQVLLATHNSQTFPVTVLTNLSIDEMSGNWLIWSMHRLIDSTTALNSFLPFVSKLNTDIIQRTLDGMEHTLKAEWVYQHCCRQVKILLDAGKITLLPPLIMARRRFLQSKQFDKKRFGVPNGKYFESRYTIYNLTWDRRWNKYIATHLKNKDKLFSSTTLDRQRFIQSAGFDRKKFKIPEWITNYELCSDPSWNKYIQSKLDRL